jgi:hypothetical protein
MATSRNAVAQLYTPIYDVFMLAQFKEETQKHREIYKEISDSTKEYKVDDLSGLGIWESAAEYSSGNYEDPVLGYPKTYTQGKFIKKFQASFESVDQDEYALLKKEGEASAMGRGARARVETDTALTLYNGFSTAGPDGTYLFYNSHPKNSEETGTTYDNLLSGEFSHDNLEAAETQIAANYFDLKGLPIEVTEDPVLLYPSALRGTVERVLNERAVERPGTTNREINRFAGRYKAVEWRYLGSWNNGSNTAWYIIFPELGFLKVIWNQKPHFTSWVDEENDAYKFKGRMLYAQGYDNWRLGFGSTGL